MALPVAVILMVSIAVKVGAKVAEARDAVRVSVPWPPLSTSAVLSDTAVAIPSKVSLPDRPVKMSIPVVSVKVCEVNEATAAVAAAASVAAAVTAVAAEDKAVALAVTAAAAVMSSVVITVAVAAVAKALAETT